MILHIILSSPSTTIDKESVAHLVPCEQLWEPSWELKLKLHQEKEGFPCGSDSKETACNVGDLGVIPGLGRSPGGRLDNPLQNSCLENSHGEKSLAGYSPWCCKERDTTEWLSTAQEKERSEHLCLIQRLNRSSSNPERKLKIAKVDFNLC